jgi:streptomycin 6-kinase
MFSEYLALWELTADGEPIVTRNSRLLPVRRGGVPAMLKVAVEPEEIRGAALMTWWAGNGAAAVLAHQGAAILLERAEGTASLAELVRSGRDDDATRIICATVATLHAPRDKPLPELVPLDLWFQDLQPAAAARGGILTLSAATARALLAAPQDVVALHGDVHHGNILDFGERGWLAIDPKGLIGERGFDYANLFCNPDCESATAPGIFQRRIAVVSETAQLDRRRLLEWILAWAGLSAAWLLADGERAEARLAVAALAAAALGR